MLDALVSGLVTGWAIAIPIGAVGAFLVTLTARTSWRVGAAGALGIAVVDGGYALVAVVAGAGLAGLLEPVTTPLRLVSGGVLLLLAALTAVRAVGSHGTARGPRRKSPGRAFALFAGVTAVNPATVVYFAAIVLGNRDLSGTVAQAGVFVLAAFVASASWQLTLATGGASLGRAVTTHRWRTVTGVVSAVVIALLAVHTMLA